MASDQITVDLHLMISGGNAAEVESLREWLLQDEDNLSRITTVTSPPRAGEMGLAAESLIVAVGSGGALTVLARGLGIWLRYGRPSVTVKIKNDASGKEIEFSAANVHNIESLVRIAFDQGLQK